jgi:hypothetical protein
MGNPLQGFRVEPLSFMPQAGSLKLMNPGKLTRAYRHVRKGTIILIGGTVLAIGLVMIVAPGPAILVIPMGLAILGLEYVWARRWADMARQAIHAVAAR